MHLKRCVSILKLKRYEGKEKKNCACKEKLLQKKMLTFDNNNDDDDDDGNIKCSRQCWLLTSNFILNNSQSTGWLSHVWDAYAETTYMFSRSLSSADMSMCLFVNPVISNFFTLQWLLHKSDTIFNKKTRFSLRGENCIILHHSSTSRSALQVIAIFCE